MASAEFLEQALSTDVDENAVNAIVGSLENQLVTSVSSVSSQNNIVNVIPSPLSNLTSSGSSIIGVQKYNTDRIGVGIESGNFQSPNSIASSVSYNVPASIQSGISQTLTGNIGNPNETLKLIYSQTSQNLPNQANRVTFPTQSIANGCIGLTSQNQLVVPQSASKIITMQPPLVIKQGSNSGQVGLQSGMVTVPMSVNSSMPTSIPNVMTLNKPGGQNVVVSTQNIGSAQPTLLPNVQILNMRPGTPTVGPQKSVATVSPRVVIGTPQVMGTRPAAPGITLQTLQSLQPGQPGHLLLKTENGQYQLLRVGPAPAASTLTAPQGQTIRLSTVPAHPGVATMSTSVAAPQQMQGPMPTGPIAAPVVAPTLPAASTPPPQAPTVTTQKPSDNTKEKCRNFLANLLDLSSKEPKSVETNVRNLIQELIDAQVEPEEFCNRLERLLNASPQPCLIGFLKKSLPLLRQSLVTKELTIEGINPPSPIVAFSTLPAPVQPVMTTQNMHLFGDEESSSSTLTPLLPPTIPVPVSFPHSLETAQNNNLNVVAVQPSTYSTAQFDDERSSSPTFTPLLPPVIPVPVSFPHSLETAQNNNLNVVAVQPSTYSTAQFDDEENSSPTLTPLLPPVIPVPVSFPHSLETAQNNTLNVVAVQPSTYSTAQLEDEECSSPTFTTLLPPVLPVSFAHSLVTAQNNTINVVAVQPSTYTTAQKPAGSNKPGTIAVLQNIPVHTKLNVNKASSGKSMTVNSKANFTRPGSASAALSTVLTPGKSLLKDKEKKASMQFSQPFVDDKMAGDDDINDVAAMGGVNLAEETQRILGSTELIGTQIRSCKDEYLVPMSLMQSRVKAAVAKHGLEEPSVEVAGLLSHAVHERLKNLVEKLAVIAQHRIDLIIKTDSSYEMTHDVKGQLKFLEELDRVDKKRREDSEREMLLRAAKSRSKNEDPEQAKLKAKAKEMQRAELEELRQREANLTALQAIGPRKKPRLDAPGGAGDSVTNGGAQTSSGLSGRSQLALRTRLKRINHRDMIYLLEQEQDTAHSPMLFRSYLK